MVGFSYGRQTNQTTMDKLKRLEKLLEAANVDFASNEQVAEITAAILKEMAKLRESLKNKTDSLSVELSKLLSDHKTLLKKSDYSAAYLDKEIKTLKTVISNLKLAKGDKGEKGDNGKDGRDGIDGKDADIEATATLVLDSLILPDDTGEAIVEKINSQENKIKKDKVEGLSDIERMVKANAGYAKNYTGVSETRVRELIDAIPTSSGSGDVTGPASSTDGNVAFFDGTTGKIIKDSGITLSGTNTGDQVGDGVTITGSGTPGDPFVALGDGTGDVHGPASSTDNAIARFDSTTGKIIQNSAVTIDDAGIVSGVTQLNVDNIRIDGNTISSTDTNGDINLTPNGTGEVIISTMHAATSAGMTIHNNAHQDIALFGPGGSQAVTFYDGVKMDAQTASRILSTDANKNITALDTATYPSLTELAYLKGTTSAVQTQLNGKEPYHGVQACGTKSFNATSHVFTLASVNYWFEGVNFTSATPITCDIDSFETLTDNTLYFFYFDDASGTLKCSDAAWNIQTEVPIALVFWNGTAGAIGQECHSYIRDRAWHEWAHKTVGTRYESGLSLIAPTTASDSTLTIGSGTLHDEDIELTISQQSNCRVFYRVSATNFTYVDSNLPYAGTLNQPQYLDTDTYALTNVGASNFANMWVYGTNDQDRAIYIIPTHAATDYNTLALARAGTPPALSGYPLSPEVKLLYRLTYKGDGQFQESVDYRNTSSLPAGGTASTTAGSVSFTPSGNISSTTVQGAIEELDAEKALLAGSVSQAFSVSQLELGNASDTTLTRVSAGVVAVEGKNVALNGTGETLTTGTIELGAASDTTIARVSAGVISVEGVTIPSVSSANTLTNKRITKRVGTTTSSATPTINTDDVDMYIITAQTTDITSFTTNLSGTPTQGQLLWIAITGTAARAITWGSSFESSTVALPTTTVTTNRLDVGFVWNTVSNKWKCIATA